MLLVITFLSCDTTSTLYESPKINHSYYRIKNVNLTHCGCNEIYVKHYSRGRKDFVIFYGEGLPSKLLLSDGIRQKGNLKYLYVTPDSVNALPFDQTDKEIFAKIDSLKSKGYLHKIHHPVYFGYKKDTVIIAD